MCCSAGMMVPYIAVGTHEHDSWPDLYIVSVSDLWPLTGTSGSVEVWHHTSDFFRQKKKYSGEEVEGYVMVMRKGEYFTNIHHHHCLQEISWPDWLGLYLWSV